MKSLKNISTMIELKNLIQEGAKIESSLNVMLIQYYNRVNKFLKKLEQQNA